MKIFNNISIPKNYKKTAIAIGNFDGIHKGHQKVLKAQLWLLEILMEFMKDTKEFFNKQKK